MAPSTELVGTAYHEAAHAIALRKYGIDSKWVEVTTERTGETECGAADFDNMAEKDVFVIALAGIYAESRVRPQRTVAEFIDIVLGGTNDRRLVNSVFLKRWMAVGANSHRAAHNAAEKFVQDNWELIEKVAKALLTKCESGLPARLNRDEVEKAIAG